MEFTKLKISAGAAHSGASYEGHTTYADLQRADHSAYLTIVVKDGTLLAVNTAQLEYMHIHATREEFEAARLEFEKYLEEKAAEKKAWDEATALSQRLLAEAEEERDAEAEQGELDLGDAQ